MSDKPRVNVVILADLVARLNALIGQSADETLVLLCRRCRKPYRFCGCQDVVLVKGLGR